tara:strand:+ start:530 stop:739 length:210 start_codon:yes stop_codon:yes gene_type:complete
MTITKKISKKLRIIRESTLTMHSMCNTMPSTHPKQPECKMHKRLIELKEVQGGGEHSVTEARALCDYSP